MLYSGCLRLFQVAGRVVSWMVNGQVAGKAETLTNSAQLLAILRLQNMFQNRCNPKNTFEKVVYEMFTLVKLNLVLHNVTD